MIFYAKHKTLRNATMARVFVIKMINGILNWLFFFLGLKIFINSFKNSMKRMSYGLINEWTLNNTLKDSIQCADLTSYNTSFFHEGSSNYNSVEFFNNHASYLQAPPGVYFNGDFTITGWVNVYSIGDFKISTLSFLLNVKTI